MPTFDNIDWGSPASLRITGDLSIGMWIKLPSNAQGCLIKYGVGGVLSSTLAWPYFISITGSSGQWCLIVGHDTASNNINNSGAPFQSLIPNDTWVYIGVSRDTAKQTYTLYLGNDQGLSQISVYTYSGNPPITAGTAAGSSCTIGVSVDYRSDLALIHLIAIVEEIYVHSRVLTLGEHLLNAKATPPSGAIRLNCPMGVTPEKDTSGNNNIGAVTGTVFVQGH